MKHLLLAIASLACCGATQPADSQPAPATELRLRFVDGGRRPVQVSRAELLLVAWRDADRLPLPVQGDRVHLNLSPSWLRSRWPMRFPDLIRAYLYVQAEGYAPVRSEPFLWLGSRAATRGRDPDAVTIDFRQGRPAVLREGEHTERTIMLRRPRPRGVTLVGDDGRPVGGVRVSAYMFWSASNHCGVLNGADSLGEYVSDDAGQLMLPDGDFEYALVLEENRSTFQLPPGPGVTAVIQHLGSPASGDYRSTLISVLQPPNTTFHVHRFAHRPLHARILRGGRSVAQVTLMCWLANCGCGACSGPLATSDADGRITVEDFYPEEIEGLFICGPDGKRIWQMPCRSLAGGTVDIDLSPDHVTDR
ncbi:MAG TPA: hypothetical protein PKY77_25120 [Phycisphaerae bacterium]|nr:hypothetical protein [Phycisphaerae bacterium]HRY71423.1 hypothetical protein [Phycisphaerae bacterium]HSA30113.1 hypothetical protein [Phycisphaerae bacterium]